MLRLTRLGLGPTEIARETGMHRQTIQKLKSRALRNLRAAGLNPEKVLSGEQADVLELVS